MMAVKQAMEDAAPRAIDVLLRCARVRRTVDVLTLRPLPDDLDDGSGWLE
jgi:hypothetical protein